MEPSEIDKLPDVGTVIQTILEHTEEVPFPKATARSFARLNPALLMENPIQLPPRMQALYVQAGILRVRIEKLPPNTPSDEAFFLKSFASTLVMLRNNMLALLMLQHWNKQLGKTPIALGPGWKLYMLRENGMDQLPMGDLPIRLVEN